MISKTKISKIVEVFSSLKNDGEVQDFIQGIFTEKELNEIVQRLEIVKALHEGVPHHDIAKKLGVGVATVTRGSKEIKKGRFSYLLNSSWRLNKSK